MHNNHLSIFNPPLIESTNQIQTNHFCLLATTTTTAIDHRRAAAHLSAPNESFEIVQEQRTEFDHQKEQQVVVNFDTQNTKSSNQQQGATNSR